MSVGIVAILDDVGVEVPNLDVTKAQALKAIDDMRQEFGGAVGEWAGWRLNVVRPEGTLLHTIPPTSILR
ncbi:DUF6894 family protein [Microvirga vignae]|uniref:DUF6894 family protein n=1 Tax=Microvirga vignae TaxID=1225564 RepID=UPI00069A3E07